MRRVMYVILMLGHQQSQSLSKILPSNIKNPPFVGEDDVIYEIRLSATRDVEGRTVVKVCAKGVAVRIARITYGLRLSIGS